MNKYVVTGASGFIGGKLVQHLLQLGHTVIGIDKSNFPYDLSTAQRKLFHFSKFDLTGDEAELSKIIGTSDAIFHLSANSSIKMGSVDRNLDLQQNVIVTKNILEAMIVKNAPKRIIFTSSSAVYGQARILPTSEEYGPLQPMSLYAASKLACEALISAYCYMFGLTSLILRLANITGNNDTHGIIYDFKKQIQTDSTKLIILSDGKPRKSYVYVDDCVLAMALGLSFPRKGVEIVNVGNIDQIDVMTIARLFVEIQKLHSTSIDIAGGNPNDGGGWKGDVVNAFMNIDKIRTLGWSPSLNSTETIKKTISLL